MSIDNPIPTLPTIEYTDVLRVGADKINDNIRTITESYNDLRSYTLGMVPQQINGLLVSGRINPSLLAGSIVASGVPIADDDNNFSATNVEDALTELSDIVDSIITGGGSGDVVGPSSSQNNRIAVFQGSSGKVIQDSGVLVSQLATAAQGALATTAVQPGQLSPVAFSGNYSQLNGAPTATNSIELVSNSFRLVGDTSAPGSNKIYGTDESGVRGWYDVPSGGGSGGVSNLDGGSADTIYLISDDIDGGNALSVF